MKDAGLAFQPIEQLAALLRRRKISPVELAELFLARIATHNLRLNAYLTVTAEAALAQARAAEREIRRGRWRGPLHGVPVALKDNIETRGIRTTAGAKFLAEWLPERDATVVRKLRRAGAVLLGKTNLHEFAYGVTTTNPHYGPARNPWDTQRIPGGSSGGAAAAVAAGLAAAAIGSDTGGSIRIPAALCGIVGLKPAFGRVSCAGVVPLAASLDHTGPIARTIADATLVLTAVAGFDPLDSRSARRAAPDFAAEMKKPLRRFRLGRPREFFFERVDEPVRKTVEAALREFEKLGAVVEEVSLPRVRDSEGPGTTIALAEATWHHREAGWWPERAADYSEEVRKRLEMGEGIKAVEYLAALAARAAVRAEFEAALARFDAIVAPTVPVVAPRIGEERVHLGGREEPVRAALLRLNRPANITGLPAVSFPCGFVDGLPVGLQLIGRAWEEGRLLRVARACEQATEWRLRRPPGFDVG